MEKVILYMLQVQKLAMNVCTLYRGRAGGREEDGEAVALLCGKRRGGLLEGGGRPCGGGLRRGRRRGQHAGDEGREEGGVGEQGHKGTGRGR